MKCKTCKTSLILLLLCGASALLAADPGRQAFENEEYEKSLNYYLDRLEKEGEDEVLHYNAGTSALKAGRDDLAALHFEQGIRKGKEPEFLAKNWYNTGHLLINRGEAEEALKAFQQAMLYDPEDLKSKFMYEMLRSQLQEQEENQDRQSEGDETEEDDQSDKESPPQQEEQSDEESTESDEEERQDEQEPQQQDDVQSEPSRDSREETTPPEGQEEDLTEEQVVNLLDAMREREKEAMKEILKYRFRDTKIEREKDW